jgi:anti-sigma B factor antagonist
MSFAISSRDVYGVTVLDLKGRLVLGEGTSELREGVRACLNHSQRVVINMAHVDYIDSAGLGELVSCHAAAAKRKSAIGQMKLNERIHGVIQMTRLYTVFEVFVDEPSAIAGMQAKTVG